MRRVPNPDDGRSYLLVLTAAGERITAEAGEALLEAYELLETELGDLQPHERRLDDLNAALTAVLARLERPTPAQEPR